MPVDRDREREREFAQIAEVLRIEASALSYQPAFGLSYDDAPEWLERDLQREHGYGSVFCTVVTSGGGYQSAPKERIVEENGTEWILVGTYTHGAETECPGNAEGKSVVTEDHCFAGTDACYYCEASLCEDHGFIYIGEGYEAVYRRKDEKKFRLHTYDVWGNAEDGYDVNNTFRTPDVVELNPEWSDREIFKAMQAAGLLPDPSIVEIDNGASDETRIEFQRKEDGKPLGALILEAE